MLNSVKICKSCGGWDNCPDCDEAFQADQRARYKEQLRADCGDEPDPWEDHDGQR